MIYDYYGYYQSPMTQFMDMGFYLGIGGVVTFSNARKLQEVQVWCSSRRL